MTKFTFTNGNRIIVAGRKINNILHKPPTLKIAAEIAIQEIAKGIISDSFISDTNLRGDLKDVFFENGAILTIPSEYSVIGYMQTLKIVVAEIGS